MNVGDAIQSLSNSPEKLKLSLCGEDSLVEPPEKFRRCVPQSSTVPFLLAAPATRLSSVIEVERRDRATCHFLRTFETCGQKVPRRCGAKG
jgi:hypothetical protein